VRACLEESAASDPEIRQIVEDLRLELPASGFQPRAERLHPDVGSRELGAGSGKLEADIVSYVYWLMDRDRKSGPLKALQGRIWEEGYATGALQGEVYPDVRDAFVRWTSGGRRIGIFSSGSVLAQRLLFGRSTAGDLSTLLSGYFDTAVGAKGDADSYRRIGAALAVQPSRILFVSDVVNELDAARDAGLRTLLCVRPPAPEPAANTHDSVASFAAIEA
jgi:enolase-phosphatase E1